MSEERTSKWMEQQRGRKGGKYSRDIVIEFESKKERNRTEEFKAALYNQDGKIRTEMHAIIRNMVGQGKAEEEIMQKLSANPEYEPFLGYASGWIKDQQIKHEETLRREASKRIIQMLQEGRKEEIIPELRQVEKYQIYESHFEEWIRDAIKKINKNNINKICSFISRRLQKGATTQEVLDDLNKRPEYGEYAESFAELIEHARNNYGKGIEK